MAAVHTTTYTSIAGFENWEDASTWVGGMMLPDVIPVGDEVVINGVVNIQICVNFLPEIQYEAIK